jgi:hypothetical protein
MRSAGTAGWPDADAAQGIVDGEMAWPLVVVGLVMGLAFVLVSESPMLVSVGMYRWKRRCHFVNKLIRCYGPDGKARTQSPRWPGLRTQAYWLPD